MDRLKFSFGVLILLINFILNASNEKLFLVDRNGKNYEKPIIQILLYIIQSNLIYLHIIRIIWIEYELTIMLNFYYVHQTDHNYQEAHKIN